MERPVGARCICAIAAPLYGGSENLLEVVPVAVVEGLGQVIDGVAGIEEVVQHLLNTFIVNALAMHTSRSGGQVMEGVIGLHEVVHPALTTLIGRTARSRGGIPTKRSHSGHDYCEHYGCCDHVAGNFLQNFLRELESVGRCPLLTTDEGSAVEDKDGKAL